MTIRPPGLGPFLADGMHELEHLSHDELRERLLHRARLMDPGERGIFLEMLKGPKDDDKDEGLAKEVGEFVSEPGGG